MSEIDPAAIETGVWLWEQFGQGIINKASEKLKKQWKKFTWKDAEQKYRSHLKELHSTTRLLGNPKAIEIEGIFTDVYVLDQMTAFQRYSLHELQKHTFDDRKEVNPINKRKPILSQVVKKDRLYILGKPGAG